MCIVLVGVLACFSHICNMCSDPFHLCKQMRFHFAQTRSHALSSKTGLFIIFDREETAPVFEHACVRLTLLLQCCCCCCCFCHRCCGDLAHVGDADYQRVPGLASTGTGRMNSIEARHEKELLAMVTIYEAPRLQFSTPQPQRTSQVLLEAPQNSIVGQPQQGYSSELMATLRSTLPQLRTNNFIGIIHIVNICCENIPSHKSYQ